MSNEKTNEKPAASSTNTRPAATLDVPRGVPVKMMRLVRATQLPGHQQTDVLAAVTNPNGQKWEIEYVAQMRHHRITYTNPNEPKLELRVRTAFVHETHVTVWEPAAL